MNVDEWFHFSMTNLFNQISLFSLVSERVIEKKNNVAQGKVYKNGIAASATTTSIVAASGAASLPQIPFAVPLLLLFTGCPFAAYSPVTTSHLIVRFSWCLKITATLSPCLRTGDLKILQIQSAREDEG